MSIPYSAWKSVEVTSINDAFVALVIEFAQYCAILLTFMAYTCEDYIFLILYLLTAAIYVLYFCGHKLIHRSQTQFPFTEAKH